MVKLENTFYNVNDDMDEVEVCAVIKMACNCYSCGCPITFSINVTLTVKGIYSYCVHISHCLLIYKLCFLVSGSPDYSKNVIFAPCEMKSCVTISIEGELGITTSQRVNVILESTDDRIVLNQTNGDIEISRIPSKVVPVGSLVGMMPTCLLLSLQM